jgi:hypothetical protein
MAKIEPLFVSETTAARMLELKVSEFRALRAAGTLPPPRALCGIERYDVDELRRVIRGEDVGGGAMEW